MSRLIAMVTLRIKPNTIDNATQNALETAPIMMPVLRTLPGMSAEEYARLVKENAMKDMTHDHDHDAAAPPQPGPPHSN
jgi:hypothetical protein